MRAYIIFGRMILPYARNRDINGLFLNKVRKNILPLLKLAKKARITFSGAMLNLLR